MSNINYFMYAGNNVKVLPINPSTARTVLDPQIYSVMFNPNSGFYLSKSKDRFDVPEQMYGTAKLHAARVFKRYTDSSSGIGAIFTGDKGSGKTLATAVICNLALDAGVPVVLINEPYVGSDFFEFMNSLGEVVAVFDEFGKTYQSKLQDPMLSFFDGVESAKRLNIITENEERSLSPYLLQRPGRFLYHFRYGKLDSATVIEYCADKNVSPEVTNKIVALARKSSAFSFDMLTAVVDEVETFPESDFAYVIEALNITSTSQISAKTLVLLDVRDNKGAVIDIPDHVKGFTVTVRDIRDFGFHASILNREDEEYFSDSSIVQINNSKVVFGLQRGDVFYTFAVNDAQSPAWL